MGSNASLGIPGLHVAISKSLSPHERFIITRELGECNRTMNESTGCAEE
jgi:hypothetical protein